MDIEDIFDNFLDVRQERIPGHGEDDFCFGGDYSRRMIGVFDGCGGLGAKKYSYYQNQTGARVASNVASKAIYEWFHKEEKLLHGESLRDAVNDSIRKKYSELKLREAGETTILGSMVKDFPTTMAMAIVVEEQGKLWLDLLWAGDSRVYLLDEDGLAQLTRDDVREQDAFLNLRSDDALLNLIHAGGQYQIHVRPMFELRRPTIVLACTDGCFGYFSSPMEFEGLLLEAFAKTKAPEEFERYVDKELDEIAGDDYTMQGMAFWFGGYDQIAKTLRKRMERLAPYLSSIRKMRTLGEDTSEKEKTYWMTYRQNYERFL